MPAGMIGILAGMGPRSTAPFIDMVVTECQRQYGARDDEDYPHMMIYSLAAPFYVDRPVDHQALKVAIRRGLQKLAATGVEFIAMPCNTAHIYYQDLAAAIDVPLLNIIDELVKTLPVSNASASPVNAVLLSTRMTAEAGIYQSKLREAGLNLIERADWQARLDQVLHTIKLPGELALAQAQWQQLLNDLAAAGVTMAILACTDLNAVSANLPANLSIFDATQSLASALVRRWHGNK